MTEITINRKKFKIDSNIITGSVIKRLAESPASHSVICSTKQRDYTVGNNEEVDISQPGRDIFFTYNPNSTEG